MLKIAEHGTPETMRINCRHLTVARSDRSYSFIARKWGLTAARVTAFPAVLIYRIFKLSEIKPDELFDALKGHILRRPPFAQP